MNNILPYNCTDLRNYFVVNYAKQLNGDKLISREQYKAVELSYPSVYKQVSWLERIVTFIGACFAIPSLCMFFLTFSDAKETILAILCVTLAVALLMFLEAFIIRSQQKFRSGFMEAVLYYSIGMLTTGLALLNITNETMIYGVLLLFTIAATLRYLDLFTGVLIPLFLVLFVFSLTDTYFPTLTALLPFVFFILFTLLLMILPKLVQSTALFFWHTHLQIFRVIAFVIVYLSMNYYVVRELSVELMHMTIPAGSDIPFAFIFYIATVLIPLCYLYMGLKQKDIVLLRISVITIICTVLTFKYYFSLGHPEITLTAAGIITIVLSVALLRYLKTAKHGFTLEALKGSSLISENLAAVVISQTAGGNQIPDQNISTGGGEFGGAGAGGQY